jgi:protein TonB
MATLSSRPTSAPHEARADILFRDLVLSGTRKPEDNRVGWGVSMATHAAIVALLVLVPILWPEQLPAPDYVRALIYNPPPPPPPPLPKGSALVEKPERPQPVTPDPKPSTTPKLEVEIPEDKPIQPEDRAAAVDQFGSETGSDEGVPEGQEEGVVGGVVGGTVGGVIGGVIGGTGDSPVSDYDQAPRVLKQTKPVYPQEGFVKKIEGTVVVEILIDSTGRVARARITQSIPALDAAALECVRQWVFAPAVKHGRPVATLAYAPVNFKIF